MDYKLKYLKYKHKYLEEKKKYNNGNIITTIDKEINSLVVSHNGRIRCLLTDIGVLNTDELKKIRFKNCSILKLSLNSQRVSVSMIYEGEVNPSSKQHFSMKKSTKDNIQRETETNRDTIYNKKEKQIVDDVDFNDVIFENNSSEYNHVFKTLHIKKQDVRSDTYNYYIVRHGQGAHNLVEGINKIKKFINKEYLDPVLTIRGIEQAQYAKTLIEEIKFDYLFASDLKRSRETIITLVKNTNDEKINIIIVPCLHELDNTKNGECDGAQKFSSVERENKVSCEIRGGQCIDPTHSGLCCNNKNITFDWSYYSYFYSNNKRGLTNTTKYHCRNTSCISIMNFIINKKMLFYKMELGSWILDREY
jgi:broad specificity phosphatase PhoE